MSRPITSSFCGVINEVPGISVDNFQETNLNSRAYFLSHCHTDHTCGLFSTEFSQYIEKNDVYVYMSKLTAAVIYENNVENMALFKRIKILDLGTSYLTLPKSDTFNELCLRITLISAGHCIGSVMFLFQTNNQTVLYTGDFNISTTDIKTYGGLHEAPGCPIKIDTMYIDTTFINHCYQYFPKRSETMKDLIENIKDWLASSDRNKVALSTSAKYGYEYVFNELHDKLGLKVFVDQERWSFYRKYDNISEGITNIEKGTKLHICRSIASTHSNCGITEVNGFEFLTVRLSAMAWRDCDFESVGVERTSVNTLKACFATHCSRAEIYSFVSYFSPKNVVGFPNPYHGSPTKHSKIDPVTPKKRKIVSPKKMVVTDFKLDKQDLKSMFAL